MNYNSNKLSIVPQLDMKLEEYILIFNYSLNRKSYSKAQRQPLQITVCLSDKIHINVTIIYNCVLLSDASRFLTTFVRLLCQLPSVICPHSLKVLLQFQKKIQVSMASSNCKGTSDFISLMLLAFKTGHRILDTICSLGYFPTVSTWTKLISSHL